MKPLPELKKSQVPRPVGDPRQPLPPGDETLVYPAAPGVAPETVAAFSSADDMDFDIVSTRS